MTKLNLKKTPGFGIGKKGSQAIMNIHQMEIPCPTTYNLRTKFEANKEHHVGPSFGIAHSHYDKVFNESSPPKGGWTEPGLYDIKTFVDLKKKDNRKMTFLGRTPN